MRRLFWLLIVGSLSFFLTGIVSFAIAFGIWYPDMVLNFEHAIRHIPQNTFIYDRHDKPFHILKGSENRLTVPQKDVSRYLKLSVLAAEDSRFFQHRGIDIFRLLHAVWINLKSGSYRQGASTITQQLVKITLLTPERTLTRKFREMFIALALELKYSKSKLLEHYLNSIYLGHGNYGVEQASISYFKKHAHELTLPESTFLAGIIKKPETYLRLPEKRRRVAQYYPNANLTSAFKRQHQILRQLRSLKWITAQEYATAIQKKIRIHLPHRSDRPGAYFIQHVISLLKKKHQIKNISSGGYKIYTTIDPKLQRLADQGIQEAFLEPERRFDQAALISIEPHTGYVRALTGGKNFVQSQFNRATQAKRQPGSAFKPFVFATALEKGFAPNSSFLDEPLSFEWQNEDGSIAIYSPRNMDRLYGAERPQINHRHEVYYEDQITLGKAFERSINSIALQLLYSVGIDEVVKNVRKLGMSIPSQVGLCLALGCVETRLLNLTAAYTPFMNQGRYSPPVFISKIENSRGQVIYQHQPRKDPPIFSEWTVHQMNQMFRGVVLRGTGQKANWSGNRRFIGGKTGTTTDYRDAWFIGFSPELVTGIWVGNDDNTSMPGETGSKSPIEIWRRFMKQALSNIPMRGLSPSPSYLKFPTCTVSGDLATRNCPDIVEYHYPTNKPPYHHCSLHPGPLLTRSD